MVHIMEWLLFFLALFGCTGWLITSLTLRETNSELHSQSYRLDMLRNAARAAQGGTYHYRVKNNENYWDRNTLRMYGLKGDGRVMTPGTWELMIHPEDRAYAVNKMAEILNSDQVLYDLSYRIVRADCAIRWIEGSGYVYRDEKKRPIEITGLHFDITNQVEQEQELKRSKRHAVQSMEAKTQFLANMSHEIRTPMNAIIGMIELLSFEALTPVQRRYISTLHNSSEILLRIINDVLDVSKIEAGKLTLENKTFNLRDVLQQCLSVHTQQSEQKDIMLTGYIDPAIPIMIKGDSTRLQQVIMNLLSNAFKFTSEGHILLNVIITAENELHFSVQDTGIGVEPENLNKLFDRFSQADDSTTRKFGGTGLGLTIVREIVHLWNGTTWVTSKLGKGSTFHFTLPIEKPLLKQDNPEGRYLLASRFEVLATLWQQTHSTPTVEWVNNHNDLKTALAEKKFSDLVVEQRFPEVSGSEIIAWCKTHYPDIKTTLMGFESIVKTEQKKDEVDNFVARPFFINQIWDSKFVEIQTTKTISNIQRWPDYSDIKVLCVDDNPSNLIVLAGLLKHFQIQCVRAKSGQDAIEQVKEQDFDMILMDYEMPDMDGPETTRRILKVKPSLIVGLSAHTGNHFVELAEKSGMTGFLRKPVRTKDLEKLLSTHFSNKEKHQTIESHSSQA